MSNCLFWSLPHPWHFYGTRRSHKFKCLGNNKIHFLKMVISTHFPLSKSNIKLVLHRARLRGRNRVASTFATGFLKTSNLIYDLL